MEDRQDVVVKNIMPGGGMGMGMDGFGMGGGLGGGLLGGVLLGALVGRGGLFGNDNGRRDGTDCVTPGQFIAGLNNVTDNVSTTAILGKLGSIEAAIPLGAAQTENVILQQTNAINGGLSALALGTQQGFSNVKDSVQTGTLANAVAFCNTNQNVASSEARLSAQMCAGFNETQSLINRINTDNISRQLTVAENALLEERFGRRARESEINITNTNTNTATAVQAQFQAQQQLQVLANLAAQVGAIANDVNFVRQGQSTVNFGTMTGSGTQAANATQVRS